MKAKKARKITREIMEEHKQEKRLPYLTESWLEKMPLIGQYFYHRRMIRNALLLQDYMRGLSETGKRFAKKLQHGK